MARYCNNCGKPLADDARFCTGCGTPVPDEVVQPYQQNTYQQNPYQQNPYQQSPYQQNPYQQSPYQQSPYQQSPYQQPGYYPPYGVPMQPQLPMKWYKFLIYFSLFAAAVINIISGLAAITGGQYGVDTELIYKNVPGLQTIDVLYGIALIGMGILALVTRSQLKNFRVNGPKLVSVLYGAGGAVSLIYVIAVSTAMQNSLLGSFYNPDYSSYIVNLITTVVVLICNIIYFNKRKHLFVNP